MPSNPNLPDLSGVGRRRARYRKAFFTRFTAWSRVTSRWVVRTVEVVAGLIMMLLSVVLFPLAFLVKGPGHALTLDTEVVGRFGRRFWLYRLGLPNLPVLRNMARLPIGLNLVRGELALVGPRPLTVQEVQNIPPVAFRRFDVRPGIASLFTLRKQANVAFDGEFATDAEYVELAGLGHDAGILARYVTTSWLGKADERMTEPIVRVLGLSIQNLTMGEASDWIVRAAEGDMPRRVCFVNADCGNLTFKHSSYLNCVKSADLVLADGIGMRLASKYLKTPIIENVNGTDMLPRLCERLQKSGASIYLLGGRPGIAEGVVEWIRAKYPDARIAGYRDGYFKPEEEAEVIRTIRESGAGLLLVAFGAPRQDTWIADHLTELNVGLAVGVGGLFDFYSNRIPRAPQWMRELGIEWLYRLIQEPARLWKRYVIGNFTFLWRVMRFRENHPSSL